MKAASFDYVRAASVAEACALLRANSNDAKLIAAGVEPALNLPEGLGKNNAQRNRALRQGR